MIEVWDPETGTMEATSEYDPYDPARGRAAPEPQLPWEPIVMPDVTTAYDETDGDYLFCGADTDIEPYCANCAALATAQRFPFRNQQGAAHDVMPTGSKTFGAGCRG